MVQWKKPLHVKDFTSRGDEDALHYFLFLGYAITVIFQCVRFCWFASSIPKRLLKIKVKYQKQEDGGIFKNKEKKNQKFDEKEENAS